jgi:hypothetical protein
MNAAAELRALEARYERVVSQVDSGELDDTPEMRSALVRMKMKLALVRNQLHLR